MTGAYQQTQEQRFKTCLRHVAGINVRNLALFVAGYFVSFAISRHAYGSLAVPSPFWLPDSVFLCALLLTPKKQWWVFFLAASAIHFAAGAHPGTPTWFVVYSIADDSLKAFFAAWLLHRVLRRPGHMSTLREFMIFLGIAAVAIPLLSALIGAPVRSMLDPRWNPGYRWFFGDALA